MQIALALHRHHDVHSQLPTNGWGWDWVGDPDRGFGRSQPGGWAYNTLPYIEQAALHDQGAGLDDQAKREVLRQLQETPIQGFNCPSRRSPLPVPTVDIDTRGKANANHPSAILLGDYAINAGDTQMHWPGDLPRGPKSYDEAESPSYQWANLTHFTGVSYTRSKITIARVTDGTANTYLVGEKYVQADTYVSSNTWGDNESLYTGQDWTHTRWTNEAYPPLQDTTGRRLPEHFGSAHSSGFHMVMCDGSVHTISYAIDPETHRRLGNRKDGLPVDLDGL